MRRHLRRRVNASAQGNRRLPPIGVPEEDVGYARPRVITRIHLRIHAGKPLIDLLSRHEMDERERERERESGAK